MCKAVVQVLVGLGKVVESVIPNNMPGYVIPNTQADYVFCRALPTDNKDVLQDLHHTITLLHSVELVWCMTSI